ncbi:MAG: exopolysaccharide biosynthesis protein [Proteobacteria bacterium]|nr:exopolysaccharide biosynthesis protein [Pseudomonadota bacterium]
MSISVPAHSITGILTALLNASDGTSDGKLSLDEMVAAFGNRAFGILYLLFGLPNCFPMPPGIPVLCGVVVIVVSVQMLMGQEMLVLPRWLGKRRVDRALLARVVDKALRPLQALERVSRERYLGMSSGLVRRAIGLAGCALGVALMAPIPIFGGIPAGIAVTILGLALAQRDGALIAFGVAIATPVALTVTSAMLFALFQGAAAMF